MRATPPLLALLAFLVAWPCLVHAFDADDVPTVFSIRKSQNENRVDYGLHLDDRCRPIGSEPVEPYWRCLELGPNVIESLGRLARRAYGISGQSVRLSGGGGDVTFRFRATGTRRVVVHSRLEGPSCRAWATTSVAGVEASITDIYVVLAGPLRVDHVKLTGRTSDGRLVTERVTR